MYRKEFDDNLKIFSMNNKSDQNEITKIESGNIKSEFISLFPSENNIHEYVCKPKNFEGHKLNQQRRLKFISNNNLNHRLLKRNTIQSIEEIHEFPVKNIKGKKENENIIKNNDLVLMKNDCGNNYTKSKSPLFVRQNIDAFLADKCIEKKTLNFQSEINCNSNSKSLVKDNINPKRYKCCKSLCRNPRRERLNISNNSVGRKSMLLQCSISFRNQALNYYNKITINKQKYKKQIQNLGLIKAVITIQRYIRGFFVRKKYLNVRQIT